MCEINRNICNQSIEQKITLDICNFIFCPADLRIVDENQLLIILLSIHFLVLQLKILHELK